MSLTFVTSIEYVDTTQTIPGWSLNTQILNLTLLAGTQVPLCIFLTEEYGHLKEHFALYPNVWVRLVDASSSHWMTPLFSSSESESDIYLPAHRNRQKDTFPYLLSSYSKYEWLKIAIDQNPWNTSHFAWIDLSVLEMFTRKEHSLRTIEWMSRLTYRPDFMTLPGCWSAIDKNKIQDLTDTVHWRFCGGFFLGDRSSLSSFCQCVQDTYLHFFQQYKKLVWDFNYLAYMETVHADRWKPVWYKGDHNDHILSISSTHYTWPFSRISRQIEYSYPMIPNYYPTSAAYLFVNDQCILNTRYVNYWIYPNGCYLFHSGKKLIENKNMLCRLDENTLEPVEFREIEEYVPYPIREDCLSRGLEDIRLYEYEGRVKYIATTMGYNADGKSRMMVGDYDVDRGRIDNGCIIYSPEETWCEKNWIPIIHKGREMFIYKWNPIEIGVIEEREMEGNDEENIMDEGSETPIGVAKEGCEGNHGFPRGFPCLSIKYRMDNKIPLASKLRGSSIFQPTEDGWMGVVHYSEEHSPRQYFHMLIVLDKETLEPIRWSNPFCFLKQGIEFCIGFRIQNKTISQTEDVVEKDKKEYVFWISRHDRDPVVLWIEESELQWNEL